MLYFHATIAVFIIATKILCDEEVNFSNSRTILFKELDVNRDCWTTEETVLLSARSHMQDLLPKAIPDNLSLLLKYFKWCLLSIKTLEVSGDVQMIVLSALADTIGGYLQYVIIPVTHEAYYAGNVNYELTRQMHALLEGLKEVLGTDGGDWAAPISSSNVNTKVHPLWLNLSGSDEACKSLILDCKHSCDSKPPVIMIPMPFFDDNDKPNAVAMPFRCRSLFNLMSPYSADILLRYYSLSMRCLMVTKSRGNVLAFNNRFHTWILAEVVPHLQECGWYPGFWGVMRIIERMKLMGLHPHKKASQSMQNSPVCMSHDIIDHTLLGQKTDRNDIYTNEKSNKESSAFILEFATKHAFVCIIVVVAMCCCSCCALCCCTSKRPNRGSVMSQRIRAKVRSQDLETRSSTMMLYNKRSNGKRRRARRKPQCDYTTVSSTDEVSSPRTKHISPLARLMQERLVPDFRRECPCSEMTSSSYCPPLSLKIETNNQWDNGTAGPTDPSEMEENVEETCMHVVVDGH